MPSILRRKQAPRHQTGTSTGSADTPSDPIEAMDGRRLQHRLDEAEADRDRDRDRILHVVFPSASARSTR